MSVEQTLADLSLATLYLQPRDAALRAAFGALDAEEAS